MEQLKDLQRALREAEGKWLRRELLEQPAREFLRVGFLQILEDAGLSLIAQELAFAVFDRRLRDPNERSGEGLAADRKDCRAAAAAANLQTSDPFEALRRGIQLRQAHVGELAAYAGTRFPELNIRSTNLRDEILERAGERWHRLLMTRRDRPGPHDPVGNLDGLLQTMLARSEADVVGDPKRLQSADDEFNPPVGASCTDDATDFSDARVRLLALQRSAIARIAPNLTFKGQYRRTLKPLFEDAAGDQPSPIGRKLLCLLVRVQKDELPEQLAGGQRYEELLEDVRAHVFSSLSKARKRGSFEKQIQRLREKVLAAIRQSPESRAARALFPSGLLAPTLFDSLSGWLKLPASGASGGPPATGLWLARALRWSVPAAALSAVALVWSPGCPENAALPLSATSSPLRAAMVNPAGEPRAGANSPAIAAAATVLDDVKPAALGSEPPPGRGGCPAGMAPVPEGSFKMGVRGNRVTVAAYCMDVTEVTVDAYATCKDCTKPGTQTRCNWEVKDRGTHPVNCVDWDQATAYCAAQAKRLPTYEEWEWAARGGPAGTRFPWGDEPPFLRICAPWAGTCPVGSYPRGVSPQGIHDLAGNAAEWTETSGAKARGDAVDYTRVVCGDQQRDGNLDGLAAGECGTAAKGSKSFGFRCVRSP